MTEERKVGRGGTRPGAGRPRKPIPLPPAAEEPRYLANSTVDAVKVAELATLGLEREDILVALRVPRTLLSDAAFIAAFDSEVRYGLVHQKISILRERKKLADSGRVSATLAGLRNMGASWDRVDRDRDGRRGEDLQSAIADVESIISRFRS